MDQTKTNDASTEQLRLAESAAMRGDALGTIDALARSSFLDGLTRRIQARWSSLPPHEVDNCVAAAVDDVFDLISKGKSVKNLGGLLYNIVLRRASDRWADDYRLRGSGLPSDHSPAVVEESPKARAERDARADARRTTAVRLARAMLPRIGQGQVIAVMEVLIDAVAQGDPDLTAEGVAEVVGISPASTRSLMSRGLKRMRELAEQDGSADLMDSMDVTEDLDDDEV